VRQGEFHRPKVLFSLETEDLAHRHSRFPLDFLIEVEKFSSQPARRCPANRRLPHSRESDEDQMRR